MLGQLHIKNIGIIDDLTVDFEDSLNIITGETGAGKSLVIDALSAIMGERTSKEIIRTGEECAFIEAYFFRNGEDIVISREIHLNGKNICKINGKLCTVSELKSVGDKLIDIHGQHDSNSLLDPSTHIELLDSFAGEDISILLDKYKSTLSDYKDTCNKILQDFGDEQERARKIDLLNFQISEIKGANLKIGEDDELLSKHKLLLNSEKIASALNSSHELLSNSVLDYISDVTRSISSLTGIDEKYSKVLSQINDAYYTLQDTVDTLADYAMEVDFDEDEQSNIEERLDAISSLKRKYGHSIKDIMDYLHKCEEEKAYIENSEEIISKLTKTKLEQESLLKNYANGISNLRKKYASKIEKNVNLELQDLEMKKAFIKFNFEQSDSFLENGQDVVEIYICTNVGDTLKPLSKIASGGELSRVMLAIKVVLGEYDSIPTMIFDEIDTGISGAVAEAVGERLKKLAEHLQVLVVTHQAQVASKGNYHIKVRKQQDNNKTTTIVDILNKDERIKEVARLFSGEIITDEALKVAEKMMN